MATPQWRQPSEQDTPPAAPAHLLTPKDQIRRECSRDGSRPNRTRAKETVLTANKPTPRTAG